MSFSYANTIVLNFLYCSLKYSLSFKDWEKSSISGGIDEDICDTLFARLIYSGVLTVFSEEGAVSLSSLLVWCMFRYKWQHNALIINVTWLNPEASYTNPLTSTKLTKLWSAHCISSGEKAGWTYSLTQVYREGRWQWWIGKSDRSVSLVKLRLQQEALGAQSRESSPSMRAEERFPERILEHWIYMAHWRRWGHAGMEKVGGAGSQLPWSQKLGA